MLTRDHKGRARNIAWNSAEFAAAGPPNVLTYALEAPTSFLRRMTSVEGMAGVTGALLWVFNLLGPPEIISCWVKARSI